MWAQNGTSSDSSEATETQSGGLITLRAIRAQVSATLESQTGSVDVQCATAISSGTTTTPVVTTTSSSPPPTPTATSPPTTRPQP